MAAAAEGRPAIHCYLVLAPDAKDASAAKEKLLLWQTKAKQ